jgi:predicted dithiol-disulfide oxidoreductase (DUF899 family)
MTIHRTGTHDEWLKARPPIVSPEEWETARRQLLVKEKALTRARDALAAERRRMPWLAVEKAYEFEGPEGKANLLDLFDRRRQLIVYRAFFEPGVFGWPDHACRGCAMVADQVAHVAHLNARDTTLVFVSRAPQTNIARLQARMGWEIPWYTLTDDFDSDFGVEEWHGTNAFIRDGDRAFRTYFLNNRGDEQMGGTWNYLDITALGRQEEWEDSPEGYPQTPPHKWWNWHDNYVAGAAPDKKWVEPPKQRMLFLNWCIPFGAPSHDLTRGCRRASSAYNPVVNLRPARRSDDPQIMNNGFVGSCPTSTLPASSNHSGCAAICLSIVCRSRKLRSSGQSV